MSDKTHRLAIDVEEAAALRDKFYNATIIERIDVNPDLAKFRVRPDLPIPNFEPGQYVALGLGNWEPRVGGAQKEEVQEKRLKKLKIL